MGGAHVDHTEIDDEDEHYEFPEIESAFHIRVDGLQEELSALVDPLVRAYEDLIFELRAEIEQLKAERSTTEDRV